MVAARIAIGTHWHPVEASAARKNPLQDPGRNSVPPTLGPDRSARSTRLDP